MTATFPISLTSAGTTFAAIGRGALRESLYVLPRVAVGMWTHSHRATGREVDFLRTHASLTAADPYAFFLFGSGDDGTQATVRDLGGHTDDSNPIVAVAMTWLVERCVESGADIVVLSADDMEHVTGWLPRLTHFWMAAPPDVALASLYLEPSYQWNQPKGAFSAGGERALVRETAPGSSWSFRARDADLILPIPSVMPAEDLAVCQRIIANRRRIVHLDLAAHIAETRSAWGNTSYLQAQPLNRRAWGFPESESV